MTAIHEHSQARQLLIQEMKLASEVLAVTTQPALKSDIEYHLKRLQNDLEKLNVDDVTKITGEHPPNSPSSSVIIQQYKARQQLISEIQTATEVLIDSTKPDIYNTN